MLRWIKRWSGPLASLCKVWCNESAYLTMEMRRSWKEKQTGEKLAENAFQRMQQDARNISEEIIRIPCMRLRIGGGQQEHHDLVDCCF